MFAEVEFEWTVVVQPSAMKSGTHIKKAVILTLLKDFNDVKCTARHGYHVAITSLESIGEGRIWERRGCAAFPVKFRCVVFNVFPFEHVLAVVTEVETAGLKCECGPIEQIFVSPGYMEDYNFMTVEGEPGLSKWRNNKTGATIKKGDVIRVKIVVSKWEPGLRTVSAVGSLLGQYSGIDDRWPDKNPVSRGNLGEGGSGLGQEAEAGGTGDDLWGEPLANEDDNAGWGDPISNEGDDAPSGWG